MWNSWFYWYVYCCFLRMRINVYILTHIKIFSRYTSHLIFTSHRHALSYCWSCSACNCGCDPEIDWDCPRAASAADARVCCCCCCCCSGWHSLDCDCGCSSAAVNANASASALAADLPSLNARNESPLSSSPSWHWETQFRYRYRPHAHFFSARTSHGRNISDTTKQLNKHASQPKLLWALLANVPQRLPRPGALFFSL